MKPKIRYFCVACQRPKMLFDTQEEADRFIAYNRGDILRGRRTKHSQPGNKSQAVT